MNMMKSLLALIAGILSVGASAGEYQAGQVWEYQTRPGEEASRLYIVRVDSHETLGNIYHIFVKGVHIKNPHIEGGIQTQLPHAPVDQKTLDASLTKLIKTTHSLPDITEGYNVWKESFDSGEGGVFNISVKQIIQYIEDVVGGNA